MTPAALLAFLRQRDVTLTAVKDRLKIDAPVGVLTPELKATMLGHKAELLRLLRAGARNTSFDVEAGDVTRVKLANTVIGDIWLVADDDVLAEHLDILRAGLPVFFFDEVNRLGGKSVDELEAIAMMKRLFPTSRVMQ